MVQLKAATQRPGPLLLCRAVACLAALAAFSLPINAQQTKPANRIITIIVADGKTGKTIIPDNYVIHFNHLNAVRNETLLLNDDGSGKVTVPSEATFISVQSTYHNSTDIYMNCDAGMEKDTSTIHWYSIADIISTGIAAPNGCYKGKHAKTAAIPVVPGEFILYVREIGWLDVHEN